MRNFTNEYRRLKKREKVLLERIEKQQFEDACFKFLHSKAPTFIIIQSQKSADKKLRWLITFYNRRPINF